jgi:hypothetical protein
VDWCVVLLAVLVLAGQNAAAAGAPGRWNAWPCPRGNPWNTCALTRTTRGPLLPPQEVWRNTDTGGAAKDGIVVDGLDATGGLRVVVWSERGVFC